MTPPANSTVSHRSLGNTGPQVSAIGLGTMGMSDVYGTTDEAEAISTIHAAIDGGIDLLDTGDFYGMGHNEMLIGRTLAQSPGARSKLVLSVKFGAQRDPDGNWLGFDARPAAVKTAVAYTLRRLRTDYIDIYRPARLDPDVPIEETVGAIAELVQAGYVRHIGLSEVGAETIRRAAATHPIRERRAPSGSDRVETLLQAVTGESPAEVVLIKCHDTVRDGRARLSFHSAFNDPTVPANAKPRQSIEIRTIAFFES